LLSGRSMNLRLCLVALLTGALSASCSTRGAANVQDTDDVIPAPDAGDADGDETDEGDGDGDGDEDASSPELDAGSDAGSQLEDAAVPGPLDELPSKESIVEVMRRVNDNFIARHPDGGDNLWARGVYFVGNMAAHRTTGEQRYLDYATMWAERHNWGLAGGAGTRYADNQVAGQTYLELHALAPVARKVDMIEDSLSAMVSSAKKDDWWWCDALFMAMPAFTRLGVLRNDERYFEKMYALYDHSKNIEGGAGLYDDGDHLWWRDGGFVAPREAPNGSDIFWGRGNGWVFGALARTLEILPESEPHRAEYEQMFVDMAAALLGVQRDDGFWNPSLHDENHFGGREASCTALFAYGFAWGIHHGLLDAATYAPALDRAFRAIVDEAVHDDGYLGFIQGVGYEPGSSQPVNYDTTSDFGVGVFLLAGSELHAIAPD
jgi:unsaturated rhamnogalacturonyl hydrolase